MKNVYIIGGTMGVGKTTVCQMLKHRLPASVFLDGDWCWDMHPFQVNEETKQMVLQNITFLLNQFIRCSTYKNVVFCWVMHEQGIIDEIIRGIDVRNCQVMTISLICDEDALKERLQRDVDRGIRDAETVARSIRRIPMYSHRNTIKIDTTGKSVCQVCDDVLNAAAMA